MRGRDFVSLPLLVLGFTHPFWLFQPAYSSTQSLEGRDWIEIPVRTECYEANP